MSALHEVRTLAFTKRAGRRSGCKSSLASFAGPTRTVEITGRRKIRQLAVIHAVWARKVRRLPVKAVISQLHNDVATFSFEQLIARFHALKFIFLSDFGCQCADRHAELDVLQVGRDQLSREIVYQILQRGIFGVARRKHAFDAISQANKIARCTRGAGGKAQRCLNGCHIDHLAHPLNQVAIAHAGHRVSVASHIAQGQLLSWFKRKAKVRLASLYHNAKQHPGPPTSRKEGTGAVVSDFWQGLHNRRHEARTRFARYMILHVMRAAGHE